MSSPSMPSSGRKTIYSFVNDFRTTPPHTPVMAKLSDFMSDSSVSVEEIAAVIKTDASLSSSVIKLSNSPFYASQISAESVEEAILRLGSLEVYRLVALVAVSDWLTSGLTYYRFRGDELWRTSVLAAILMEHLARATELNHRIAYTCGLLHAIGRCQINQYLDSINAEGHVFVPRLPYLKLAVWERENLGADYAEVSGTLLARWGFSPELHLPIWHHLDPLEAPSRTRMACLLRVSTSLAASIAMPQENDPTASPAPAAVLDRAGLSENTLADAIELAQRDFASIHKLFSRG